MTKELSIYLDKGVQEVNEIIQKVTKGLSEFHLLQGLHVR